MKTTIVAVAVAIVMFVSVISVYGAGVAVQLDETSVCVGDSTRLEVDFGDSRTLGGVLTIDYDKDYLKFCDVSSDSFETDFSEHDRELNIVFVREYDDNGDNTMILRFRGEKTGMSKINLDFSQAVDINGNADTKINNSDLNVSVKIKDKSEEISATNDEIHTLSTTDTVHHTVEHNKDNTLGMITLITGLVIVLSVVAYKMWYLVRK